MTVAIICQHKDPQPWRQALQAIAPEVDVQIWPNIADKQAVEFALCWKQPHGVLNDYPNLQCISSMGAGVEHLLADDSVDRTIPIVRIVDTQLAQGMFDYLLASVMLQWQNLEVYHTQQSNQLWQPLAPKSKAEIKLGVMGLGELGGFVAASFSNYGFSASGWSLSKKSIDNVDCYFGDAQLKAFLQPLDFLVCLLPLTAITRDILNSALFNQLPKGARLINVGRGEHLVEQDLINALDCGQLSSACLDVFRQEPLPPIHPFWTHSKIRVTPHCSSVTVPLSVAPQIIENYQRLKLGKTLLNQVDIQRGY